MTKRNSKSDPQSDLGVLLKSPKGTIKNFPKKAKIPAKMLSRCTFKGFPEYSQNAPGYFHNDPKVHSKIPQGTLRVTHRTLIVTPDYPDSTFKVITRVLPKSPLGYPQSDPRVQPKEQLGYNQADPRLPI